MGNESNFVVSFKQTLKVVESPYRDNAGFHMTYDELEHLCRDMER